MHRCHAGHILFMPILKSLAQALGIPQSASRADSQESRRWLPSAQAPVFFASVSFRPLGFCHGCGAVCPLRPGQLHLCCVSEEYIMVKGSPVQRYNQSTRNTYPRVSAVFRFAASLAALKGR